MSDQFLLTTSSEGLTPLGTAAQRSYELVSETLRARVGEDAALLLAEPVAAEGGERIDWYAPIPGRARPLNTLDPKQQESAREILDALVIRIRAEAETLQRGEDAADLRLGEALFNAVEIPDEGAVHVIEAAEGRLYPVLVSWAWVRETQATVRGVLKGQTARARPTKSLAATAALKMPRSAAVAPSGTSRSTAARLDPVNFLLPLGWLLLAGMIAAILWLLIAACGLRGTALVFCTVSPAPAAATEAESPVLEAQVGMLEHEIALARGACLRDVAFLPPLPQDPEGAADQVRELDRRLDTRGAQRGDLTFTLVWDGSDDMDLHVTCPTGQKVGFRNRRACNGWLDVDANAGTAVNDPVENIVFNDPQTGTYRILVVLHTSRTGTPRPFRVRVSQRNGREQAFRGSVRPGNNTWNQSVTIR